MFSKTLEIYRVIDEIHIYFVWYKIYNPEVIGCGKNARRGGQLCANIPYLLDSSLASFIFLNIPVSVVNGLSRLDV